MYLFVYLCVGIVHAAQVVTALFCASDELFLCIFFSGILMSHSSAHLSFVLHSFFVFIFSFDIYLRFLFFTV